MILRSLFPRRLLFVSAVCFCGGFCGVSAGVSAEFVSAVSAGFLRGFCGVSAEGPNHVPKVVLQRFVSATKFEVTKFLYKK